MFERITVWVGKDWDGFTFRLRPKTRDDLHRRMIGHRRIADFTYGMFGRSPDHVASFVTGMAMKPDELKLPFGHPEKI